MKKFFLMGAALTALVLGLTCFVACSDGEESRSVVAEYQKEDYTACFYIFYSDGTFVYKESAREQIRGTYYNSPTTRGLVSMMQESYFDENSEKYISMSYPYNVIIEPDGDGMRLIDEDFGYFFLKG